jgi:hypothetical protein
MRTDQKLRLKRPNGWFPAGQELLKAMAILPDGPFKLFVFLCINADRRTGTYSAGYRTLAALIGKSRHSIEAYAAKLKAEGLCSVLPSRTPFVGTTFRISDEYWPFVSDESDRSAGNRYAESVRDTFLALGCTSGRFGFSEQRQALDLEKRGIALEIVTDAMLLGACRKYVAWLNGGPSEPICSVRYFEPLIEEVLERPWPAGYREYMRLEVDKLSALWAESRNHKSQVGVDPDRQSQKRDGMMLTQSHDLTPE